MSRTIEDIFRPTFEEIRRRQTFCEGFEEQPFDRQDKTLYVEQQRFALLTVGTKAVAPLVLDAGNPCLRVYGCFETREEAAEHGEVVRGIDPRCSLIVVPCQEWFLFPQTPAMVGDAEACRRRRDERLAQHRGEQQAQSEAFDESVRARTERPVNWRMDEWSEEQEEMEAAESEIYKRPRRLRAGGEVRNQAAFVFSVVRDTSGAGEVLVKIYGAFPSVRDAAEWTEEVAVAAVGSDDLLVADTCEWLYPNAPRIACGQETYRIGELQTIMDFAKQNPKNVKSFKQWLKEDDKGINRQFYNP